MSQIETVIRASKQLEQLLAQHYGATGRGLHEKTSSVEDQLDNDMVRRLRKIATLRNKVVHEDFEIDDLTDFQCDAQSLAQQLHPKATKPSNTPSTRKTPNQAVSNKTTSSSPVQPKPDTRPTVKKPNTTESANQPAHTAAQPPQKARPIRTLTPQPRVQPRVKLSNENEQYPVKRNQRSWQHAQPASATPAPHRMFSAISGLLIFLTIIWILAH